MRRHKTVSLGALFAVTLGASACATRSFVRDTVDEHARGVAGRVSQVERMVEDAAVGTGRNTARIREVDDTATSALETAKSAETSAEAAQGTATDARARAQTLEVDNRRLLFEVVLADEHGHFALGDPTLPKLAPKELDGLVKKLRTSPRGIFLEVEGHTDASGSAEFNKRLGLARAESVRRYLHEHHHLPLHKINVISYGEERPVAPNDTIEGRAKNRRAVIRVLG